MLNYKNPSKTTLAGRCCDSRRCSNPCKNEFKICVASAYTKTACIIEKTFGVTDDDINFQTIDIGNGNGKPLHGKFGKSMVRSHYRYAVTATAKYLQVCSDFQKLNICSSAKHM